MHLKAVFDLCSIPKFLFCNSREEKSQIQRGCEYQTFPLFRSLAVWYSDGAVIYVTDGMFCMNGTTSVPKSVFLYTVDKVRQLSKTEV